MSARVIKGPSVGLNIAVFAVLLLLLMGTVLISQVELGAWNLLATVGIASLKAFLILSIFMRVCYARPLIGLIAGAGFIWLAILFTLVASDYVTR